ncbi:MAG: hypothetical protein KY461_11780 [Actinobacteria bacterium]|nr:hypothetical protein [Actinomycetota bacterium]
MAAAVAHLDLSWVLSLAFLGVAAVQLSVVGTARRWPAVTAELLTFTNLAAVGAWAVSRTVGLPLVGLGVEPIAVAGVATVMLELAAIAVVTLGPRLAAASSTLGALAIVASLGTVAIATPVADHADTGSHGHDETETDVRATDGPGIVQLGPGDFDGDTDLTKPDNVDRMEALMTGAVQPIVITSDGRLLGSPGHGAHDTSLADAVEERRRERASESEAPDDEHPHADDSASHGH